MKLLTRELTVDFRSLLKERLPSLLHYQIWNIASQLVKPNLQVSELSTEVPYLSTEGPYLSTEGPYLSTYIHTYIQFYFNTLALLNI